MAGSGTSLNKFTHFDAARRTPVRRTRESVGRMAAGCRRMDRAAVAVKRSVQAKTWAAVDNPPRLRLVQSVPPPYAGATWVGGGAWSVARLRSMDPSALWTPPLYGQGQVVSATLVADIGKAKLLGSARRMRAGGSWSVFRKMEVVRDVYRFRRRGIAEEEQAGRQAKRRRQHQSRPS